MADRFSAADHELFTPNPDQHAFDVLPLKEWPAQLTPGGEVPGLRLATIDGEPVSVPRPLYRLGNPAFSVAPYREYVTGTMLTNQEAILESETGTGKSSQVGLYLVEAGAPRVFYSSPRIVGARDLYNFARQNFGPEYEHLAAYATGDSTDSEWGPDARLIYATEQLLFKLANRGMLRPDDKVVFDEAHERSVPGVMLLGILKEMRQDYPNFGTYISSATIDTVPFAQYLPNVHTGEPAPIIKLPGRNYPITYLKTDDSVADAVHRHMAEGRNVLAFESGIHRMRNTWSRAHQVGHTIHMLHGDQSPSQQQKALTSADGHHVVATKVAETSLTPVGKDVTVDSGLSNLGGYEAGKRVLSTEFSSKATMTQRAGRISRTKPGIYEEANPGDTPPPPDFADRPDYDPPSIQNQSVAAYIPELLAAGRKLEDLDLLEGPTAENLQYDMTLLRRLGAISVTSGGAQELTDIGRALVDLPLDVPLARMLVEAERFGKHSETPEEAEALRLQVAAGVAVRQIKGILDAGEGSMRRYVRLKSHQDVMSSEVASDFMFELDVFAYLYKKQQAMIAGGETDAAVQFENLLAKRDIVANRYYKAARLFEELCRREEIAPDNLQRPTGWHRKQVLACQIAGTEEVFVQQSRQRHRDIRGESRTVGRRSTVTVPLAQLVIGTAFDLRLMRESGRFQRCFITGGSVVTYSELAAYAPHRLSEKSVGYGVTRKGEFMERRAVYFDGVLRIHERQAELPPTRETREALIRAMMTGEAPAVGNPQEMVVFRPNVRNADAAIKSWLAAQDLQHKSSVDLKIADRYESLINETVRDSLEQAPLNVTDVAVLDELIPRVFVNSLVHSAGQKDVPEILRQSPDGITLRRGEDEKTWIPVTYRNQIAYVTIPREDRFGVRYEDFSGLVDYHDVKLRVGNGKYQQLDVALARIEEQRNIGAAKRHRRERAEAHVASAAVAAMRQPNPERARPPRRDKATQRANVAIAGGPRGLPVYRQSHKRLRLMRSGKYSGE